MAFCLLHFIGKTTYFETYTYIYMWTVYGQPSPGQLIPDEFVGAGNSFSHQFYHPDNRSRKISFSLFYQHNVYCAVICHPRIKVKVSYSTEHRPWGLLGSPSNPTEKQHYCFCFNIWTKVSIVRDCWGPSKLISHALSTFFVKRTMAAHQCV